MKKLLAVFLISSLFSISALAKEVASEEEVKKFINDVGNTIIDIASEKKTSEEDKKERIITVVDKSIDPNWIARFVLGKNYRTATDEQKERFTKLYRDFMINTYGPKFKNYNGRKFEVTSVTKQNRFYIAKAEFLPKDSNTPISVDFRVKEQGARLVILDFIAEGISLIETQRSEFNSAISQNGMDKFLDILTTRVENLKKSNS